MFLNIFNYSRLRYTDPMPQNSLPNWHFVLKVEKVCFLILSIFPPQSNRLKKKKDNPQNSLLFWFVFFFISEVEYLFITRVHHLYFFGELLIRVLFLFFYCISIFISLIRKTLYISGILTFCLWPEMFKIRNPTSLWGTVLFKRQRGVSA